MSLARYIRNPILYPDPRNYWEAGGTFNPCVINFNKKIVMLYRALSAPLQRNFGEYLQVSSIGYAESKDGFNFKNKKFFFGPEYAWEGYGCEDPRIVFFEKEYYIFYTAVASWPPVPDAVKVALATTKDFKTYKKLGIVTPFNAKAMSLFPKRINGKVAAIFQYNSDRPPSKVIVTFWDEVEDMVKATEETWKKFVSSSNIGKYTVFEAIPPQKYVEVGAPPIETEEGWLMIYPDITPENTFRIAACLLDYENPTKILAKTKKPLLEPMTDYEIMGNIPNVLFPSGALVKDGKLWVYYGAADKYIGIAYCNFDELMRKLIRETK